MFTGIIENKGIVTSITVNGSNKTFWIKAPFAADLKVDQSLSHNGVCLTVEEILYDSYRVTAIEETLKKTNLGQLRVDSMINLERCLQINGRIDGHIVQGHVDGTAICTKKSDLKGSWEYVFEIHPQFASLIIEKGSIALNGISLTIYNAGNNSFTVSVIPYTFDHTNIGQVNKDDIVNVEFDMIGKYINRMAILNERK